MEGDPFDLLRDVSLDDSAARRELDDALAFIMLAGMIWAIMNDPQARAILQKWEEELEKGD